MTDKQKPANATPYAGYVQPPKFILDFEQVGCAGPFPVIDGRVRVPVETIIDLASKVKSVSAEPVAWFIDWPDEPEAGYCIAENPWDGARNRPLVFRGAAPVAAQVQPSGDRAMLESLMRSFDMEAWNCPNCTATEETKDCDSAIMLREYLANNPVPAQAQQPASGADWLPDDQTLIAFAEEEQFMLFCDEDEFLQIARAVLQRFCGKSDRPQPPVNPGQLDHFADTRKMVTSDQLHDAAQMIEPSGVSGELNFQVEYEAFKDAAFNKSGSPIGRMDGKNAAWWAWVNRAALAQQDAGKVDALNEAYQRGLRDGRREGDDFIKGCLA